MLAAGAIALVLVGCGGRGPQSGGDDDAASLNDSTAAAPHRHREVSITLDGYDGPENVGILLAEKGGYFADVGLRVAITSPAAPARPLLYVASRSVDFGVTPQPQVAVAAAKGAGVVGIGSLVSQPTAAMIWLEKSKIGGLWDLKGKTIAYPGLPFQKEFLESILARVGLTLEDVKLRGVGYELVPALVKGEADATFGGSANLEGAVLEARGLRPVITPVRRLGVPDYDELVMIARTGLAEEDPQLIRDFWAAVSRATAAAVADPARARRVIEGSIEPNYELNRAELEAELEATLPLLSESGYMDPGQAERLVDWMREQGLIQREVPASKLLTNRFLKSEP